MSECGRLLPNGSTILEAINRLLLPRKRTSELEKLKIPGFTAGLERIVGEAVAALQYAAGDPLPTLSSPVNGVRVSTQIPRARPMGRYNQHAVF